MTGVQLAWAIGALLLLGVFAYCIGTYNAVQRMSNIIPEVWSNISVLVTKRTDLISKLTAIVDSYGLHESGVNIKVSSELGGSTSTGQNQGVVQRLASLRMAFPELKADSLYENLMVQLTQVESDIANRREQYNSTIRAYNTALSQFPDNLVLLPFRFESKPFLTAEELFTA